MATTPSDKPRHLGGATMNEQGLAWSLPVTAMVGEIHVGVRVFYEPFACRTRRIEFTTNGDGRADTPEIKPFLEALSKTSTAALASDGLGLEKALAHALGWAQAKTVCAELREQFHP